MKTITSGQNAFVKEVKALKNRKFREEKGLFFIEGLKFVREALNENAEIVRAFVSEQFAGSDRGKAFLSSLQANRPRVSVVSLTDRLFRELSDTQSPQGILAVVKSKISSIHDLLDGGSLFIVLDSLQDPGNMGAIIRTADASGFAGIVVSKGSVDVYNPKVLRSTMGSIFRVPVAYCDNLEDVLQVFRSKGITIYAAHLSGGINCFEAELSESAAVIIGNESGGIRDSLLLFVDKLVKIPMVGNAESLNASVAAAIFMYESVRQRMAKMET
jgi:TrmH family RNA methyltransferase